MADLLRNIFVLKSKVIYVEVSFIQERNHKQKVRNGGSYGYFYNISNQIRQRPTKSNQIRLNPTISDKIRHYQQSDLVRVASGRGPFEIFVSQSKMVDLQKTRYGTQIIEGQISPSKGVRDLGFLGILRDFLSIFWDFLGFLGIFGDCLLKRVRDFTPDEVNLPDLARISRSKL